jgi:hypothetical protein
VSRDVDHALEERIAFLRGLHPKAHEVVTSADVCEQTRSVLMEVEDRARPSIEDASLPLDEPTDGSDSDEKWFELIERR